LCSALGLALTMSGCLSDDSSLSNPTGPHLLDASIPETGFTYDASGSVSPPDDAAIPPDAAPDAQPTPPVDAGHEGGITQIGLVTGSTLSRSAHYQMVGTSGPATAPLQKSPKYTLVGGMSVSTQTP
jgi:hypothetical protein